MTIFEEPIASTFSAVSRSSWQEQVEKDLKGADPARLRTQTLDGFYVEPLYTAEDVSRSAAVEAAAGLPPFRRGSQPLGQSGERWCMRQAYNHPDPGRVAQDLSEDLNRGVGSVWLRLDRSVRLGETEIVGDGMACPHLAALNQALAGVPLPQCSVALDAGGNALVVAAQLFAAAEARGVPLPKLRGALHGDPLGSLARDGVLPFSLEQSMTQLAALAAFCVDRAPGLRAVGVSLLPYHNAGASPGQEIGLALATGLAYVRALLDAGLSVDDAAAQLQFTVPIGSDFFGEIAKLRALRQCWSQLLAHCGASLAVQPMVLHAVTSEFTKTQYDPYVNMLRVTTEAFSAAAAGIDALTTSGFDSVLGPSEPFARRIASNTQVILNEESHVARVADPAGGSYFVEALTDALAEAGYNFFQTLEHRGGMAAALTAGHVANHIAEVAQRRQEELAKRKLAITGVSEFANLDEKAVPRAPQDVGALASRLAEMASPAAERPTVETQQSGAALVASLVAATAAGGTVAGITAALAQGQAGATTTPLPGERKAQAYEELRSRSAAAASSAQAGPRAFLCNLGSIPEHKARASFATGFMQAGGIRCLDNDGFKDVPAAVAAFTAAKTPLAVICGSDAQYAEWLPTLAPELRKAGGTHLVLAGRPDAHEAAYRSAGITDFIFMGCNVVGTLDDLLTRLGVSR